MSTVERATPALELRHGQSLFEWSQRFVVGGVKRMNLLDDCAYFPAFFQRASGPYVWDVDENRYVDLIAGKGAVILGYADPRVDDAVRLAIANGGMLPLTSDLYPSVAERVRACIRSVERVKFFRSGSEALTAALRLARVHTGRDKILTSGYHGWHDWTVVDASEDEHGRVVEFRYDIDRLEELLRRFGSETAAVVVTPEPSLTPSDLLSRSAALARDADALFVLDEVKTGFRFGLGGYQAAAGVRPDLTTFAKAVANGYAFAGVGGRRDVMEAELRTRISGTYETENVGLAAAGATIQAIEATGVAPLHALYERFADELNEHLGAAGAGARCFASAANAHVIFEDERDAVDFYRSAAATGALLYCFDDVNLTFAHEDVLDELLQIVALAIRRLPRAREPRLTAAGIHRYLVRRGIRGPGSKPDHPLVTRLLAV